MQPAPAAPVQPNSPHERMPAEPRAYLIRMVPDGAGAGAVGWLVVAPDGSAAIVNLDMSGTGAPRRRQV
jgi:hypothetical protein